MKGSISFTSAGLGAAVLVVPGLLLGIVAKEPALISVVLGFVLLIIVNTGWSWWVVHKVSLTINHPGYATMGNQTSLEVDVTEPTGADIQALVHPDSDRKWITVQVPASGTIKLSPSVRGVFTAVEARVRSSFPLGLVTMHRWMVVSLQQPLHVAPKASLIDMPGLPADDGISLHGWTGSPTSIRGFAAGDQRRDIHWPSSARTGSLMVRDRGVANEQLNVTVVVDLHSVDIDDTTTIDQVLGWTRTAVEELLSKGYFVSLQTAVSAEKSSSRHVEVSKIESREQLIRGLASATAGHPYEATDIGSERVLRVSQVGLGWQR